LRLIWPAVSGFLWNTGNIAGYEALDRQCLAAAQATGDKEWEAVLLSELGFVAMEKRDWAAAGEFFGESQAIHDAIPGHALEQARLRRYRASLAKHRGELDEALALLDECESRLAALSNPPESRLGMALVLLHSARMSVHHRRGELALAATAGLIADRHFQEIAPDDGHRLGEYKLELGDVLHLMGNDAAAREMWSEIVPHHEGENALPEHAEARLRLSWLAGKEGDRDRALRLARDARQTLGRFGRVARVARAEDLWADLERGAALPSFADLIAGCDYPDY
jgi:tetratricopeptide (TPR) repeat protein